ncbi:MAG: hypothetical protein KDA41_08360, partial [Planctomycetales bacterium]|nr:hypothetical protein [Planctomycetales bacterium]
MRFGSLLIAVGLFAAASSHVYAQTVTPPPAGSVGIQLGGGAGANPTFTIRDAVAASTAAAPGITATGFGSRVAVGYGGNWSGLFGQGGFSNLYN